MAAAASLDPQWQNLLHQSEDLVAQDNFSFPQVQRNLPQLQQHAQDLRNKTNRFRTLNNQISATRVLAQQGFDASRLTQEVTSLEIQPTIEDVFNADTSSVEEYIKQIEDSTILSALEEAQQQTVAAFDAHMEDCMARDWAANKKQLYGLIAPLSGAGVVSSPLPGGGTPLLSTPSRQGAAGAGTPAAQPTLDLPASEQAYIDVMRRANEAQAKQQPFDLVAEFKQACRSSDGKSGSQSSMKTCWALLLDMLTEARTRHVTSTQPNKFLDALAAGARKNLERGHCVYMSNTVQRHKVSAERGADPDPLRQVQAFIQVKLGGSRGPLDFQTPGGVDTTWLQVYYCLRNGWLDAAKRAAEHAQDVTLVRLGDSGFKTVLDDWIRNGGKLAERTALQLARACETLLHDKTALKTQVRQPYVILVLSLLAGDARTLDALNSALTTMQLPSVLGTIEDYMWCKLLLFQGNQASPNGLQSSASLISSALGTAERGVGSMMSMTGAMIPPYTLADLQADINRWPASYYSKQGKEPLLYLLVLLLTLQFGSALRFLWQDEMTKTYRTDAVHLAIALFREQLVLPSIIGSGDPGPDVFTIIHAYGRKFVHHDSGLALQYYMLAATAKGDDVALKGKLLRELLTESRDFGTLLGGGSGPGGPPGGVLGAFVADSEERKRLFEAVAYECQMNAQLEEAVELYLVADRPRHALAILNQQLSALIPQAAEEAASGMSVTGADDKLKRVLMRGRDARDRLGNTVEPGSRREQEAFEQLTTVWELVLQTRKGRWDLALQKLQQLSFLPLERERVEPCSRLCQTSLHPTVQERLPDILSAAAEVIGKQKVGATRDKLFVLKNQLDSLIMFANNIAFRVPLDVYQKLSQTAAQFS